LKEDAKIASEMHDIKSYLRYYLHSFGLPFNESSVNVTILEAVNPNEFFLNSI
jgi:hypothetical protein